MFHPNRRRELADLAASEVCRPAEDRAREPHVVADLVNGLDDVAEAGPGVERGADHARHGGEPPLVAANAYDAVVIGLRGMQQVVSGSKAQRGLCFAKTVSTSLGELVALSGKPGRRIGTGRHRKAVGLRVAQVFRGRWSEKGRGVVRWA